MRPAAMWRLVRMILIVLGAFAGGIGAYAGSRALWPLLVLWSPWLLAGMAAIVALRAWWLLWRLPKQQVNRLRFAIRDPKARADVEDNFRKTIGQLLGSAAVLIGVGLAYVQFTQQQRAAHDLLISNQVAKGFELLGNKDNQIQQRLGGIYALEGVMNTSEEYHKPVLEALSAFVRDGTGAATGDKPPATDIQAALTVIGRRAAVGEGEPDLVGAHISNADLSKANLSHASLDFTDLNDASLAGANLKGATLINANLSYALLGFADLSDAFLVGANLNGALLEFADLSRANLAGANLKGAKLIRANLSHAFLNGTAMSAALSAFRLEDANLGAANLEGANLLGANLSAANLEGASLSAADLSFAYLSGAIGLTQDQLDQACGENVKLDPGLTIKPCQKK